MWDSTPQVTAADPKTESTFKEIVPRSRACPTLTPAPMLNNNLVGLPSSFELPITLNT